MASAVFVPTLEMPTPDADNLWEFWKTNAILCPTWFKAACEVAIVMTSSASVERMFSLYDSLFNDYQQNALEDYKSGAVMLHFNEKQRKLGR